MHRARAAQDGRYARGRGGATVHELMASFDWRTPGQAKVYTDAADRKRLAGKGIGLLDADRNENADCRTENSGSVAPEENPGLNPPRVAGVEGLEPPTPGFGDRCSGQLSYTPSQ